MCFRNGWGKDLKSITIVLAQPPAHLQSVALWRKGSHQSPPLAIASEPLVRLCVASLEQKLSKDTEGRGSASVHVPSLPLRVSVTFDKFSFLIIVQLWSD